MNEQLQNYARKFLKKGLLQCTESEQYLFKRMYSHRNLDLNIDIVVDNLPEDKLDFAMQQVERTLEKKNSLKQ